jgi:hypothetical protein
MKGKAIIAALLMVVLFTTTAHAAPIKAADYDLRTVSDITAEELEVYMHPETKHLAEDVIEICTKESVSAEFIITVMRWERRSDLHNYFGWTKNNGRLARFSSDIECLEFCIPAIKRLYLSENGRYFNGYTVADVSKYYNNSEFWRKTITVGIERILNKEDWK